MITPHPPIFLEKGKHLIIYNKPYGGRGAGMIFEIERIVPRNMTESEFNTWILGQVEGYLNRRKYNAAITSKILDDFLIGFEEEEELEG